MAFASSGSVCYNQSFARSNGTLNLLSGQNDIALAGRWRRWCDGTGGYAWATGQGVGSVRLLFGVLRAQCIVLS